MADQETRNYVNDYFFITLHDDPVENANRQGLNGQWPPEEEEMILNNLSFRNYVYRERDVPVYTRPNFCSNCGNPLQENKCRNHQCPG